MDLLFATLLEDSVAVNLTWLARDVTAVHQDRTVLDHQAVQVSNDGLDDIIIVMMMNVMTVITTIMMMMFALSFSNFRRIYKRLDYFKSCS